MVNIKQRDRVKQSQLNTGHSRVAFFLGVTSILYIDVVGPLKVVDVGLICATIFFLPRLIKINQQTALLLVLLFIGWLNASLNPYLGLNVQNEVIITGVRMIAAILMFAVVSKLSSKELKAFATGIVVSGAVVAVLSVIPYFFTSFPNTMQTYQSRWGISLVGTMPDPNRFALVMASCFCLYFWRVFNSRHIVIDVAVLVLFGLAIFMTASRGAIVSLAAATIFTITILNLKYIRRLMIAYVVVSLILAGLYFLQNSTQFDEFGAQSKFYAKLLTDDGRLDKVQAGVDLWQQYPIIGIGFAGYTLYAFQGSSHNSYIEILTSFGLVGIIVFFALLLSISRGLYLSYCQLRATNHITFDHARFLLFAYLLAHISVLNIHYMIFAYGLLGLAANRASIIEIAAEKVLTKQVDLQARVLSAPHKSYNRVPGIRQQTTFELGKPE